MDRSSVLISCADEIECCSAESCINQRLNKHFGHGWRRSIKANPMLQFLAAQASGDSGSSSSTAAPPPLPLPLRPRLQRREQPSIKETTAMADEHQELTRAFSGLGGMGVEEAALVSAVGRWRKQPEKRAEFRRGFPGFFTAAGAGDGSMERCEDAFVRRLKTEFSRLKNLTVLWAMHPWERDARWAHHVLHKAHPPAILVEVACTRTADELLGARRAYQALYHRSLEEDVAHRVRDARAGLLVGLVSAYRYEGSRVDENLAMEEAKALAAGTATPPLLQSEQVVRVLTTRSKPQLRVTFRIYRELHGKPLEEELAGEPCLQEAVRCLDSPAKYYGEVISEAFKEDADKQAEAALTRVVVSRSDADMEEIKEAYLKLYGDKLVDAVAKNTHGHYRDALLAMIGK